MIPEDLQKEIELIKQRNLRVEADKAWEQSVTRIGTICLITYLITGIVFFQIRVPNPFANALIPTIAFFLSMQSLPFLKKWWVKKYLKQK